MIAQTEELAANIQKIMEKYNEKMKHYSIKAQKQQEKIDTYNTKLESFAMNA